MRVCGRCGENKDVSLFSIDRRRNAPRAYCKPCDKEVKADYYKKNYTKLRAIIKRRTQEYRDEATLFVNKIKSKPCSDCGQTFHPCAMDFDHVRGTKLRNISKIVCHIGRNLLKLKAELAKCELVCANCHRVRTLKRQKPELFLAKNSIHPT